MLIKVEGEWYLKPADISGSLSRERELDFCVKEAIVTLGCLLAP